MKLMNSCFAFVRLAPYIVTMVISFALLAPIQTIADCSEEEMTAVFLVEGLSYYPTVFGGPDTLEGKFQNKGGDPNRQGKIGIDLSRNSESNWHVDTFNCANLDANTPDNHAWWCGAQFASCDPEDPPEGYGNSWYERLGWNGTVPDPSEPVTVTVRARLNLDTEIGYDSVFLQYVGAEDIFNVWEFNGFAEGLMVDQTFIVQPEFFNDPFDSVHLRWSFKSDGAWSDEDCSFPSAGAVQIDLIEVFFDQGEGPVQMGESETCEPGTDLQWSVEIDELQLGLLDVAPLGTVTNPSMAEMIEAVEAVQPNSYYQHHAQAGPFHLFYAEPGDLGGCAIVDGRDGRVLFAGTVIWLGQGSVTLPVESSHSWSFPQWAPAAEPAAVEILPNYNWLEQHGSPAEITDAVVDYLRGTDVLQSFSNCGSYDVVSYIYTPEGIPGMSPDTASQVIIVSGQCGPPWYDAVSAAPLPPSPHDWLVGVGPNPFNPRTTFSLDVPRPSQVRIAIYTLDGRLVTEIANRSFTAGDHSLQWTGLDDAGNAVSSGTYIARLTAPEHTETVRLTLLR